MNILLEAALEIAAEGHPVLPVVAGGKSPLAALVPHGLKDATTDRARLAEWWGRHPDANVGMRCDGLLVIDVDPGGDLAALQADFGPLPETRSQSTPRGGKHLLYRVPAGVMVGNSTRGIGSPARIDIRAGAKGYVVVGPSANGDGAYEWENRMPIAEAPARLVEALTRREPPLPSPRVSPRSGGHSPYGQAALDGEVRRVSGAPEGHRNSRLNDAAFACGQLEAGGELEPGDAEAVLLGAALAAGLPQAEAVNTIRRALGDGGKCPRSAPEKPRKAVTAVADEPRAGTGSGADGGDVEFVTFADFVAHPVPDAEPLVTDTNGSTIIPAAGLTIIWGEGGSGKTTLMLDGACHFAAGKPWLDGLAVPARPLRILWIENEGPREEFRRKIERKLAAWTIPAAHLHTLSEPWGALDLRNETHRARMAAKVAADDVDLVIIGPLNRLGMEGGGTPDEVRAFVRLLEDIQTQAGRPVSILVLHHNNRAGQISGAWEGAPDLLVHVQAQGNGRTRIHWQKARWSSSLHGTSANLLWGDNETFTVEEKPEITEATMEADILAAATEIPGGSWSKIRALVPGNATQAALVRDTLLANGKLVNTPACAGQFNLWNPNRPEHTRSSVGTAVERGIEQQNPPLAAGTDEPSRSPVPDVSRNGERNGTAEQERAHTEPPPTITAEGNHVAPSGGLALDRQDDARSGGTASGPRVTCACGAEFGPGAVGTSAVACRTCATAERKAELAASVAPAVSLDEYGEGVRL